MSMGFGSGRVRGNPSGMVHTFSQSPQANIPRSVFDRSHGLKTTFNEGYLIPILADEAVPGDTFSLRMRGFARILSPLDTPIMDNIYLETFFFAVPYRLVWEHWEQFNGWQPNGPSDSTDYLIPQCYAQPVANSLQDYFGIPPQASNSIYWDNLHFRAYNLIWNEWFRDQNLQNAVTVDMGDGPDTMSNYVLLQRNKRYDYFTSCLPWPQKVNDGSTLNVMDITGSVTLTSLPTTITGDGSTAIPLHALTQGVNDVMAWSNSVGLTTNANFSGTQNVAFQNAYVGLTGTTSGSGTLTGASFTINQLREAFQIQKLFERDARGGTRYTEIVRNHFGVISPDMRLQRPEYLGGGSSYVNIHPVAQTSGTSITGEATPQANLAAFGTASVDGHGFTKSFTEHMLIIGLVSTRADLNYQQGLERMWSRQTRYDFYWPSLSHIGEQAVLNQEIYATGTSTDTQVFGYQERFAEYRYKPSNVTGEFRSTYSAPLDNWHLAQKFTSLPSLNSTFIVENAPMSRIVATTSVPHFIIDAFFQYKCARPMPLYGVPGLIDHF